MPLRPIPLNLLTLYADLAQGLDGEIAPATISRRRVGGNLRIYAITRDKRQRYIGTAGDPEAEAKAANYRSASARAKSRRKTITALKAAGVPAPDAMTGRVVEAFAQAGLFDRGAVLVGTTAFQMYPMIVGAYLSSGALMTQDADIAIARLAVRQMVGVPSMHSILAGVDKTFDAKLHRDHKHAFTFQSDSSYMVDVLTTQGRSEGAVLIRGLDCGAQPLKYLDYLIERPLRITALIGSGVEVVVPQPIRYALHKLIVAQRRGALNPKTAKDVTQARELIEALRQRDPRSVEDAMEDLQDRGPAWRKLLTQGLALANTAR
jgi:hypothetical protein